MPRHIQLGPGFPQLFGSDSFSQLPSNFTLRTSFDPLLRTRLYLNFLAYCACLVCITTLPRLPSKPSAVCMCIRLFLFQLFYYPSVSRLRRDFSCVRICGHAFHVGFDCTSQFKTISLVSCMLPPHIIAETNFIWDTVYESELLFYNL